MAITHVTGLLRRKVSKIKLAQTNIRTVSVIWQSVIVIKMKENRIFLKHELYTASDITLWSCNGREMNVNISLILLNRICHGNAATLNSYKKLRLNDMKAVGRKAFRYAAPTVWNSIPFNISHSPSIGSFKRHLKTYLFTLPG